MRVLLQRVSGAQVKVENERVGRIGQGLLLFLGVTHSDTEKEAAFLVEKVVNLRIFGDEEDKMNRSLLDVKGEVLVVSQFTLYGDCRKGRRPAFIEAAPLDQANVLYEKFMELIRGYGIHVEAGRFQAIMEVELTNSGPVTLMLEN